MNKLQQQIEEIEEAAYRRGYSHGIQEGYHSNEEYSEIRKKIKKWRFNINIKDHPFSEIELEAS